METINTSSNSSDSYINRVECNKNEKSNDFSIKVGINSEFKPNEKFLLKITEGEVSTKNVIAKKELTGSGNDYVNFENLDFKLDSKYYVWLLDINGFGSTRCGIITTTPMLENISYILDMKIVKDYGYCYSDNSTGITKIDQTNQKKEDYPNIEFDLIYDREKEGQVYDFFIPRDRDPKIDIYSRSNESWMFKMIDLQGRRDIYNYIAGKTRFMNISIDNKTKSLGPYSKSVDYKYVFPKLRAPEGEKLFSVSKDNKLTLNWYVQNAENTGLNNVCQYFKCYMDIIDDKVIDSKYNNGSITSHELSKGSPVIKVSVYFGYYYDHFSEKVTRKIILVAPEILLVEWDTTNDSFKLNVSWKTEVEVGEIKRIKIILSDNSSVVIKKDCLFKDGITSLENLSLDPEKKYKIEASYFIEEGIEVIEGDASSSVSVISSYPKSFTIEYKDNLYPTDLDSNLNEEYSLVANWQANLSLEGEYVEIQYTNNQNKTSLFIPAPSTTPPLQITNNSFIQAKIRKRTTKSIGPWSDEVSVPFMGISEYDFDHAGRLLKTGVPVTTTETQTNKFEYDDRGNILSKEISQHKN